MVYTYKELTTRHQPPKEQKKNKPLSTIQYASQFEDDYTVPQWFKHCNLHTRVVSSFVGMYGALRKALNLTRDFKQLVWSQIIIFIIIILFSNYLKHAFLFFTFSYLLFKYFFF